MIPEKALVLYKASPALTGSAEDGKITISLWEEKTSLKVREKDIQLLHPGPCGASEFSGPSPEGDVRSAWELMEGTGGGSTGGCSLKELAELVYGAFTPQTALGGWRILRENLFFTGEIENIKARPRADLEGEEKKRAEKARETAERGAFLERFRKLISSPQEGAPKEGQTPLSETDKRFLLDVEALARGRTDKSRTLRELGKSETPQEAHRFLLAIGAWTPWDNPHPGRFGLSPGAAKADLSPPPEEDRLDLSGLHSFAIDNSWSVDPDDAVSLEGPDPEGRLTLWVHVADPAASAFPGSPADLEARNRGTTLYLPEGSFGMLAPRALPLFALGFGEPGARREKAPALSFKITLNPDLSIAETSVIPSQIRVTRLSYQEADDLVNQAGPQIPGSPEDILARLFRMAEQNMERRLDTGAVLIEMPEVHIRVRLGENPFNRVSVEPVPSCKSGDVVRECMVLAGEGIARWAMRNRIPFPFISQEAGDLPRNRLPGLAGAWQLRRSMRSRSLSVKPGVHWGLGLDVYTQVTSPLRRYTDLLAHQQIRAFLKGGPLLSDEEILFRLSAAEAAASAAAKAERASRAHWTAVYLSDKKDSPWEGVVLDSKGSRATVIIPALGLETQLNLRGKAEPNDPVSLTCLSVRIPEGEAFFAQK